MASTTGMLLKLVLPSNMMRMKNVEFLCSVTNWTKYRTKAGLVHPITDISNMNMVSVT